MLNEALTKSGNTWEESGHQIHRDRGQRGKIKNKVKLLLKIHQFQT